VPEADATNLASPLRPTIAPLRKRLISAGVWSFVGRGAAIGLFFLTDVTLARALPKEQFAAFFLATQATVFFAGVASLGTPQILSRTLRQVIYGPHPEFAATVLRNCSKLLFLGCAVGAVVFFAVTPLITDDGPQWSLYRDAPVGIVVWSCLAAACLNLSFALQGLDDFRNAALVGSRRGGVLPNFAFLAFSFVGWRMGLIDLKTLVWTQVALQMATLAFGRWTIQRRLDHLAPRSAGAANSLAPDEAAHMTTMWYLKESLPFLASILVTLAIDELDGIWVGRLTDAAATADYGTAKRLVRLITTPYVMFAMSIAPFSAELLAKGEKQRLEKILRSAATLVSLPMLAVFAAFILAPGSLLALAFGEKFRDAAPILQWLTLGQAVFVPLGFGSQVLLMAGRQKSLMYVSAAALAGYCALTPVAAHYYGAPGAAAVQSAAFIFSSIATAWFAWRQVGVWTAATFKPSEILFAVRFLLGRRGNSDPVDGG
jgi:O-antigen/teichoic acid export membrane protein